MSIIGGPSHWRPAGSGRASVAERRSAINRTKRHSVSPCVCSRSTPDAISKGKAGVAVRVGGARCALWLISFSSLFITNRILWQGARCGCGGAESRRRRRIGFSHVQPYLTGVVDIGLRTIESDWTRCWMSMHCRQGYFSQPRDQLCELGARVGRGNLPSTVRRWSRQINDTLSDRGLELVITQSWCRWLLSAQLHCRCWLPAFASHWVCCCIRKSAERIRRRKRCVCAPPEVPASKPATAGPNIRSDGNGCLCLFGKESHSN